MHMALPAFSCPPHPCPITAAVVRDSGEYFILCSCHCELLWAHNDLLFQVGGANSPPHLCLPFPFLPHHHCRHSKQWQIIFILTLHFFLLFLFHSAPLLVLFMYSYSSIIHFHALNLYCTPPSPPNSNWTPLESSAVQWQILFHNLWNWSRGRLDSTGLHDGVHWNLVRFWSWTCTFCLE